MNTATPDSAAALPIMRGAPNPRIEVVRWLVSRWNATMPAILSRSSIPVPARSGQARWLAGIWH